MQQAEKEAKQQTKSNDWSKGKQKKKFDKPKWQGQRQEGQGFKGQDRQKQGYDRVQQNRNQQNTLENVPVFRRGAQVRELS